MVSLRCEFCCAREVRKNSWIVCYIQYIQTVSRRNDVACALLDAVYVQSIFRIPCTCIYPCEHSCVYIGLSESENVYHIHSTYTSLPPCVLYLYNMNKSNYSYSTFQIYFTKWLRSSILLSRPDGHKLKMSHQEAALNWQLSWVSPVQKQSAYDSVFHQLQHHFQQSLQRWTHNPDKKTTVRHEL